MKSTRKYVLAVCALALGVASPLVHAADDTTPPAKKEGARKGGPDLKQELGLTDAQDAAIKKIQANEREQLKALRDKEGDPKEKRAEGKKIHDASQAKIEALLTPEQKAKYEAILAKHKDGPGGGPAKKAPKGERPDA